MERVTNSVPSRAMRDMRRMSIAPISKYLRICVKLSPSMPLDDLCSSASSPILPTVPVMSATVLGLTFVPSDAFLLPT